jgi:hypothetical protein
VKGGGRVDRINKLLRIFLLPELLFILKNSTCQSKVINLDVKSEAISIGNFALDRKYHNVVNLRLTFGCYKTHLLTLWTNSFKGEGVTGRCPRKLLGIFLYSWRLLAHSHPKAEMS